VRTFVRAYFQFRSTLHALEALIGGAKLGAAACYLFDLAMGDPSHITNRQEADARCMYLLR
jgi:hypothetical protein